jgi:hypothetical protein
MYVAHNLLPLYLGSKKAGRGGTKEVPLESSNKKQQKICGADRYRYRYRCPDTCIGRQIATSVTNNFPTTTTTTTTTTTHDPRTRMHTHAIQKHTYFFLSLLLGSQCANVNDLESGREREREGRHKTETQT